MKIPFINKKQYIVLKAYTHDRRVLENSPIYIAGKLSLTRSVKNPSFNTCFSNVISKRSSFTLPSWSELEVDGSNPIKTYVAPNGNELLKFANHKIDSHFPIRPNATLTKIIPPWVMECSKPNMLFVINKHMMNTTKMDIVSGITSFCTTGFSCNIFNIVDHNSNYKIPYQHSLVSGYPMSDLPLHVEVYDDAQYFHKLNDMQIKSKPYFRASKLKERIKLNNKG